VNTRNVNKSLTAGRQLKFATRYNVRSRDYSLRIALFIFAFRKIIIKIKKIGYFPKQY